MKTLLLNLDILFFKNYDQALSSLLKEIDSCYIDQRVFIGYIVMEIIPPKEFKDFRNALIIIKDYVNNKGISSFRLILMNSYKQYEKLLKDFDIIYFDFLANLTINGYKRNPAKINTQWNSESKKFLLLTGIPHRMNRAKLLHKIYKENLLNDDSGIWSFFEPFSDPSLKLCRRFLSDLNDLEFDKFLKYTVRKVDEVEFVGGKFAAQTRGDDYTVDKEFYQDTTISIISETFFHHDQPSCDVSEKTWRAIINRHPFFIAGAVGICQFLESMGFKTFREYLSIDYDVIEDDNDRLDAIVCNLKGFEKIKLQYKKDIENDINHNYNKILEIINRDKKTIEILLQDYEISQNQIDLIFNSHNYWHLITTDLISTLDQKQNP